MLPLSGYLAITLITLLASLHCAGMCGGFAIALGAGAPGPWSNAGRQMLYSLGRLTTYMFLGCLAAAFGERATAGGTTRWLAVALSVAAGVVMIAIGLHQAGIGRRLGRALPGGAAATALLVAAMRRVVGLRGAAGPLLLGLLTGLLPCGLIWGWLLQAAAVGSTLGGSLVMLFFGLGTLPTMLLVGLLPHGVPATWRRRFVPVAGWLLVAFGVVSLLRGLPLLVHAGESTATCIFCLVA